MLLDFLVLVVILMLCLVVNLEIWLIVELFFNIVVENDVVFVDVFLILRVFVEEVVCVFWYELVIL